MKNIVCLDINPKFTSQLKEVLNARMPSKVFQFTSISDIMTASPGKFDAIIIDYSFAKTDVEGLSFVSYLIENYMHVKLFLIISNVEYDLVDTNLLSHIYTKNEKGVLALANTLTEKFTSSTITY